MLNSAYTKYVRASVRDRQVLIICVKNIEFGGRHLTELLCFGLEMAGLRRLTQSQRSGCRLLADIAERSLQSRNVGLPALIKGASKGRFAVRLRLKSGKRAIA